MDFDKIRLKALQSAEESAVKEMLNNIDLSHKGLIPAEEIDIVKTLQVFASHVATEAISLYHQELKEALAKEGIKI